MAEFEISVVLEWENPVHGRVAELPGCRYSYSHVQTNTTIFVQTTPKQQGKIGSSADPFCFDKSRVEELSIITYILYMLCAKESSPQACILTMHGCPSVLSLWTTLSICSCNHMDEQFQSEVIYHFALDISMACRARVGWLELQIFC